MRCAHRMPFGAQLSADGTIDFRLWAPDATHVELELGAPGGRRLLPMTRSDAGWHAVRLENHGAGTRYRYRIDGKLSVPDPASRCNPDDVHGDSMVTDPRAFDWPDTAWRGRPWEEAIIYELHLGAFTPAGSFLGAMARLDYLRDLGITALEIMPIADFPGMRNWGYDGVLPFAPDAAYGTPDQLKQLIAAAHGHGLMVFLDVVYNHFGPEGNYLHAYASPFFTERHRTPWGAAINFDGPGSRTVRDFFIHNALYWIEEFRFDGLRLDAVHAIADDSDPDIVMELTQAVRSGPGRDRAVHLILENDRNRARYLRRADFSSAPLVADAQWNDDFHHAAHVLATGERDGYYMDYAQRPLWLFGRTLAEGFGYQGESSAFRQQKARGEPSRQLPPVAFVNFLQCHDQVGNRAFGDRIAAIADPDALRLCLVCWLLAPSIPMLFMGEEFAAGTPFQFFCDFGADLADAVREGRRREFAAFERFRDPAARAAIPDPNALSTFMASKLRWEELDEPRHQQWERLYRQLLALRKLWVTPHLTGDGYGAEFQVSNSHGLNVDWILGDYSRLHLRANFSDHPWNATPSAAGKLVYITHSAANPAVLPAWGAIWTFEGAAGGAGAPR